MPRGWRAFDLRKKSKKLSLPKWPHTLDGPGVEKTATCPPKARWLRRVVRSHRGYRRDRAWVWLGTRKSRDPVNRSLGDPTPKARWLRDPHSGAIEDVSRAPSWSDSVREQWSDLVNRWLMDQGRPPDRETQRAKPVLLALADGSGSRAVKPPCGSFPLIVLHDFRARCDHTSPGPSRPEGLPR